MVKFGIKQRYVWIDWMKVIGITLVVFGHFHSPIAKYVYVFHVPLFFLISGILSKVESDNNVFWKKIFFNLIIPVLIICNLKFLVSSMLNFRGIGMLINDIATLNFKLLLGDVDSVLGTCWFVYSLIIMKIIYQYASKISLYLSVIFLLLAFLIHNYGLSQDYDNSWYNVLLTYIFFSVGGYLHKYIKVLNEKNFKFSDIAIISACFILLVLLGYYNGDIDISSFCYGHNILAFVIGGFIGSLFIYEISKVLNKIDTSWLRTISVGTIVILGFHGMVVTSLSNRNLGGQNLSAVLLSLLIVVCFIPIIVISKKYFPYLIGVDKAK